MVLLLTVNTKILYTKARQYFTYGVFRKTSIKTKFFFTTHGGYNFFLNKSRTRRFSPCVPKNFFRKLSCFYYSPWIQFFSKQMQDNTLLTVWTKKLLLTQSFLLPTVDTNYFPEKVRTRRFSRSVPKTSMKTELFILLTLDKNFFLHKCKIILCSWCVPKDFY